MFRSAKSSHSPKILVWIVIALLIPTLGFTWAFAGNTAPASPSQPASPDTPGGWGDDGKLEVGVEWMNHFPNPADDRSHWDESCDGLYNQLLGNSWIGGFHWTDYNAWETDFKLASRGGEENDVADAVDLAMICTHGAGATDSFWNKNLSSVYFGSSHTDQHLSPGDAYKAFGDKDLEWLAFDSCSVLSDGGPAPYYNRGYWASTMNGLHLLLGFNNTMYVWAPGDGQMWAFYMLGLKFGTWWILPPFSVTQAWFMAVDYVQPNVTCARVLAEDYNNYNDHLWGRGYVSPDPVPDGYYWYWDHCSTGPAPQRIEAATQPETAVMMPVFQVLPRDVNEEYLLSRIAPAFGMTGTLGTDERFLYMTDTTGEITQTLQVDLVNGGYNFKNLSKLWVPPTITPTLPSMEQSLSIVENFFNKSGEGLPAAWYRNAGFQYNLGELVQVQTAAEGNQILRETEVKRIPTDVSLTYSRNLLAEIITPAGITQQEFPVVGPGGQMKIYLGDGGEILGIQGGSRDVQSTGEMVPVMDAEVAWELFLANKELAIPQIPWSADRIAKTSERLGYYEHPLFIPQNEFIPVWIFNADFYAGGELLAQNVEVYVPASTDYMPPEVQIIDPVPDLMFASGELIHFNGEVLKNGKAPFTYEWYSNHDGFLGSGESIAAALTTSAKGGQLSSHIISLKVTDANGQVGTATRTILIKAAVNLPYIVR